MDQQLKQEIRFITSRLGDIIREQGGDELFNQVEDLRQFAKKQRSEPSKESSEAWFKRLESITPAQAHSIAHAFSLFFQLVNICEERARSRHLKANPLPPYSIKWLFQTMKENGVTAETVRNALDELEIQPVLTAHPTEAKRRAVLNQLTRLPENWNSPDEVLETLWHTDEVRSRGINPLHEVDQVLFWFDLTISKALPQFYREFDEQLRLHYPEVQRTRPFLTYGTWVGGDRDGHPFVTPSLSLMASEMYNERAVKLVVSQCERLVEELTHASTAPKIANQEPLALRQRFQPGEDLRSRISNLKAELFSGTCSARHARSELAAVRDELIKLGARRAADGRIADLLCQLEAFGFHAAEMDFRDHRNNLDSPDIEAQLITLRTLQEQYGPEAAHRYIISGTQSEEDILKVFERASRIGLTQLDIVPLFETMKDLANAAGITERLLERRSYREHIRSRGDVQEVMLGYSDSNKDGGYLMANWALHQAQRQLAATALKAGVKLRLFHGKGGPIDRGGGASHRTLRAQPFAAPNLRLRITEQGEVISLKYGEPFLAQRNLEQLTSAVLANACLPQAKPQPANLAKWEEALERVAVVGMKAYQGLVYETPDFAEYFWEATPIDVLQQLKIASRPARRRTTRDIRDLRAIPWVFSWTQSRHLLSAWFGTGAGLQSLIKESPAALDLLRGMYRDWPLFKELIRNAELSLVKADMGIAAEYAKLVRAEELRNRIFGIIRAEYEQTVDAILKITEQKEILESQPVVRESIRLRAAYIDPLHYLQLSLLKRWREVANEAEDAEIRRALSLTVNGIAFGMKSVG
ncbi:MAG TPA: phosphoenolpyruvate carboxylase [Methylomirabilota bacterium]|nr:phosphoenolpyruvate carboxylase [Methylomirabilota bacterium]